MPHINDLPVGVLWRILYWAATTPAKRLSEWKEKLPLVAVCRAWTKLVQLLVFHHVYVEYAQECDDDELSTDAASIDASTDWTSNAELLIARQCTLMARRLTSWMVYSATSDHLRHIALNILQLDRVDWMYINTLNFDEYSSGYDFLGEQDVSSEPDRMEFARTMQYFGQNMRNIAELNFTDLYLGDMGYLVGDAFASMYGGQLQILRVQGTVLPPIYHLSRHVAVLELTLDSSAARVLPSICGETLRVLKLSNIPRNFAWHHFRYDVFVRPIVFSWLTILSLSYRDQPTDLTKDEVQRKTTSGAYNCDKLCFPVLKKLEVDNCTPDCDLLYADTPFPGLEKVDLSGTFDEIRHCRRLKLNWVGDLYIYISLLDTDDMTDFYSVTNHFFSRICISRTASLALHLSYVSIDPELIRWANLTNLELHAVSFETFCKLIARLPNLTEFETVILEFGTTLADNFSVDESLFRSTDPLLAWGAKLTTIFIRKFSDDYQVEASVIAIQALALRANALKMFFVPMRIRSSVAAFIDEYKNRYPHLDGIELHTRDNY
ncbi:hypothetical protein GGF42_001882 [Coemansia sp. RSA 2424]|nr:hypothetical protein GGF42_001882 [Coemansia sp. RSA 2424]